MLTYIASLWAAFVAWLKGRYTVTVEDIVAPITRIHDRLDALANSARDEAFTIQAQAQTALDDATDDFHAALDLANAKHDVADAAVAAQSKVAALLTPAIVTPAS